MLPRPKIGVGCCLKPAMRTLSVANAGVTQLVEYLPSKQAVASSSLVPRSIPITTRKMLQFRTWVLLPQRTETA